MFWRVTWSEFIKIAAKPRSYIGLAAITALVSVILFALKSDGQNYIEFITASFEQTLSFEGGEILDGPLAAFIVLQMLIIQVPLLVALVTGDLISGEAAMGTLRLLLTRPISRTRLFVAKYVAGLLYTLVILLWLGFLALLAGYFLFGAGDLMVLNSDGLVILPRGDVLWRFLAGFAVAYLALATVATLSLTLSCFADNSIGPIVATMAIILLFTIIGSLEVPVFDGIRPWLFTTHMASWRNFFEVPVPMPAIARSAGVLLLHIGALLSIALYHFNRKDILS